MTIRSLIFFAFRFAVSISVALLYYKQRSAWEREHDRTIFGYQAKAVAQELAHRTNASALSGIYEEIDSLIDQCTKYADIEGNKDAKAAYEANDFRAFAYLAILNHVQYLDDDDSDKQALTELCMHGRESQYFNSYFSNPYRRYNAGERPAKALAVGVFCLLLLEAIAHI